MPHASRRPDALDADAPRRVGLAILAVVGVVFAVGVWLVMSGLD